MPKTFIFFPKWRKFAKSGHTGCKHSANQTLHFSYLYKLDQLKLVNIWRPNQSTTRLEASLLCLKTTFSVSIDTIVACFSRRLLPSLFYFLLLWERSWISSFPDQVSWVWFTYYLCLTPSSYILSISKLRSLLPSLMLWNKLLKLNEFVTCTYKNN